MSKEGAAGMSPLGTIQIFPWSDNLETGIPVIDGQHRRLVELLNKLADYFTCRTDFPALEKVFDELTDYASYHFSSEEEIWHEFFPEGPWEREHQATHQDFIQEIRKMRAEQDRKTREQQLEDVLSFLTHWLAFHILDTDKRMAKAAALVREGLEVGKAMAAADSWMSGVAKAMVETVLNMYQKLSSNTLRLMKEIIARQKLESELQLSEQKFRALVEASSDCIWEVDASGRYSYLSPNFQEYTGYAPGSFLGKTPFDLPLAEADGMGRERFSPILGSRQRFSSFERSIRHRDGRLLTVESNGVPIFDEEGEFRGMRGITRDITLRKEAEKALLEAKHAAEIADQGKSKFLAAASHDLRQPLMAINLFLASLAQTPLSEEQEHLTHALTQSCQSLSKELNLLFDIAKYDSGGVKAELRAIRSSSLFEWMDTEFTPLFLEKSLRFNFHFPPGETALLTDGDLLKGILRNILCNALKYCERGGVLVSLRKRGNQALIQVWDTGIGIAPEHIGQVFEEYYQVGNKERDRTKGTGLGLSIVRRQAKLLEARIELRSRLNRGSVFGIGIPLADGHIDASPTPPAGKQPVDAAELAGRRLVIIENDVQIRNAMQQAFLALGLHVTCHADAESALASPDIAESSFYISDFRLPGPMNGLQLLDAIDRISDSHIRAILITGETGFDLGRSLKSSIWKVLLKPCSIPEMLDALLDRE